MEVPYIFVVLNTIAVIVYVYAVHVFEYTEGGVQYLSNLAFKIPDKINSDPTALTTLKGRDLPNAQRFLYQRDLLTSHVIAAIIINTINYAMYPYEGLLYPWMEYILVGACVIANLDTITIGFALHKNKHIVDIVCTAYYNLTLNNDENNRMVEAAMSIDTAFQELMKDLGEFEKKANQDNTSEDNNKNGKNEK